MMTTQTMDYLAPQEWDRSHVMSLCLIAHDRIGTRSSGRDQTAVCRF